MRLRRILGISVILAVLAEIAAKSVWGKLDARRGLQMTHQIRRDWLVDLPENRKGGMVQLPYGLYWNRPFREDDDGVQQTNQLGYRQGAQATITPKPCGCTRILALGSSTTFSDRGCTPDEAWPAQLEVQLNCEGTGPGYTEVINAGLNYALSTELLIHFVLLGSALEPDLVIWEGPGNDWLPAACGDESYDYRATRAAGNYPRPRAGEKAVIRRSYLARLLLAVWLRVTPSTGLIALEPEHLSFHDLAAIERMRTSSFEPFRRNLVTLCDLCTSRGVPLVLVPFLTGSLESKAGTRSRAFVEAQSLAEERLNQIMADVSYEYPDGVVYLDGLPSIPDELFIDGTHLKPEGEKIKAQWIKESLLAIMP
jgi:lysophospholipase L1-like esterase